MHGKIIVIGSSNTDMVIKAERLPLPGETILGGKFFMFPGGKGANQAVAAARLGSQVALVTRTGNDVFGRQALSQFREEGIDTSLISTDEEYPSGVALIAVDAQAENIIVVAPGANMQLTPKHIDKALAGSATAEVALLQLEIPIDTVSHAVRRLWERGSKVILNPAPAQPLPDELFACLHLITPNETEAEILTGIRVVDLATATEAASRLRQKGVQQVVLTLGAKGAFVLTDTVAGMIPAPEVEAVDTTAAGDVFNGALAVGIAEDMPLERAVLFACRAAAIAVTRMGAQASAPYRHELGAFSEQAI